MSEELKTEAREETTPTEGLAIVEALQETLSDVLEQEDITNEGLDIVGLNKRLDNYDVILEKFTDILTISENKLITSVDKNIINLGYDLYKAGKTFCAGTTEEKEGMENLYKFLARDFEYIGIYLFTFSDLESPVGVLTNKIDNLLYDFIGNTEDLLQQFNLFQGNFRNNKDYDLKSLVTPLMFNLSNLGTNIACVKSIIHYIKLVEETSTEAVLENILQHMSNEETSSDAIAEESTH